MKEYTYDEAIAELEASLHPFDIEIWHTLKSIQIFENRATGKEGVCRAEYDFTVWHKGGIVLEATYRCPESFSGQSCSVEQELEQTAGKRHLPAKILAGLFNDAANADQKFEDWADNGGYNSDSIKALRLYRTCRKTYRILSRIFGNDEYERFLSIVQQM